MAKALNIAIVSGKGGIGKSTVSLCLFEAFRQAGEAVALEDWDIQGTCQKALSAFYPDHADKKPKQPNIILWDTRPDIEHPGTKNAIRRAQVVLVLTTPEPAEAWEAAPTVAVVKKENPDATVRVVCNKQSTTTMLGRLMDTSKPIDDVPFLPTGLYVRECYKRLMVQGWNGLTPQAKQEALEFAVSVLSLKTKP